MHAQPVAVLSATPPAFRYGTAIPVWHCSPHRTEDAMNILWIVIIGFVAGLIARFLAPGPNNPAGFILTTLLGIAGAFLATFIGQAVGWYGNEQGAGLIASVVGAVVVLFIWHRLVASHVIGDPGSR
jgi:uncharacterized membrane protein YeaQ/YmgE (transglycosylase-associated protein family)